MGRSQETFNKKENEKKKQKKKNEKAEKREERKASGGKGKSLDDMMAYVDEFGNITSTPPDPTRKKSVVNAEDIQIGIARQTDDEDDAPGRKGIVAFFNDDKGFGFIKDSMSGESIFVHANKL
ncbi:MAG: cold shock domain-containing protein, partial [Mucilaginibacter polytrichastri]|nr:cold shock domain-containing protein [Mucilaginibacter polytrichastri]